MMTKGPSLTVSVIDTEAELATLRPAWQALQQSDLEASVFLTWEWLAPALRANPFRWSVLVVRDPSEPAEAVAILPLKYRTHWSRTQEELQTHLEAGGRLAFSEYTGFLCVPGREDDAIPALARRLMTLPWTKLSMRYVNQHYRARLFTDAFSAQGYSVQFKDYFINKKQTNNLVCPQVYLPESFASYLATKISANRRQSYQRFCRKSLDTGEFRITHATDDTFAGDLDALLSFWIDKWREDKGASTAEKVAENYGNILTMAQKIGALYMPVLWKGDTRVAALGHIRDDTNGVLHFIVAGRDTGSEDRGIGQALHFHSIEWAISQGFICYDFCHGNEPYKYSYGAEEEVVLYFSIRRPEYDPQLALDSLSTGEALHRAVAMLKDGKTGKAMRVCEQLAELLS